MKRGTSDGIARNGGKRGTSFRRSSKQRRGARERARSSGARELEQLKGFAYHLVLVDELLAGWRLQEIETAILTAAALAAHHGDDVARLADAEGIAGELLYPPDEIFYDYSLEAWIETLVVTLIETLVATLIETLVATLIETLVADRKCHGIGINHYLATIEKIAANPIHYHSVAFF